MNGEVAVITGAGSGIGRATAVAFAGAGARVVVADVDEEGARATVAAIGDQATFVPVDVAKEEDVDVLFERAAALGRVRAVHNNAGITMSDVLLHEITPLLWDRLMGINLRGAWLVLARAVRLMRENGGGAIVNTASVAAFAAISGRAPYCVSKAGIVMLTRAAAIENGGAGVRINAVAPGPIATPLMLQMPPGGGEALGPPPSNRLGLPEEVAAAVVWLCSGAASYVNGACLVIDGGWSASVPARRSTDNQEVA